MIFGEWGSGVLDLKYVRNPETIIQRIRPVIITLIPTGNEEQIVNLIKLPSVLNILLASINLIL